MTFDQILYFIEAAKQEHFGKASRILRISPSAISHAISALESELGQTFFDKNGKNISLSPAGRVFLPRASSLALEMRRLQEDFSSEMLFAQKQYNLSASHGLAEIVAQLLSPMEDLEVTLQSQKSGEVVNHVLEGRSDIGLCYSPQTNSKLTFSEVSSGNLRILVRKDHPILKKIKPLSSNADFSELNKYPACLPRSFAGIEVCDAHPVLGNHGIEPQIQFIYDSYNVVTSYIQNTNAWSLVPDWIIEKNFNQCSSFLRLLPTTKKWDANYSIKIVTLKERSDLNLKKKLEIDLKSYFCARI